MMICRKGFVLSPLVLLVLFSLFATIYLWTSRISTISSSGLEQRTELSQKVFLREASMLESRTLLASLFLNATSFLYTIDDIENYIDSEYGDVSISEEAGVVILSSVNLTVALELPFSELSSFPFPFEEVQNCLHGCRCGDMSYISSLESCLGALDSRYAFTFSHDIGCSNSGFEAVISISRRENRLSILYPTPVNNGSPVMFSC